MARFINGRLLPTFLPASPTEEMKPSLEMIMKEFDKTHQRIHHSLQRLEDSLSRQSTSQNKKQRLDVPKDEVSKSTYDEFGLECGESTVIDQPTNEEHEVDISIKILEQAKRINLEACDGEHTSWKEEGHTVVFQRSPLQEYLGKACSTLSLNLHNGEEVWYKGEGAKFSIWVLQVDQDRESGWKYMMQCQHDEDDLQIWDPGGQFHRFIEFDNILSFNPIQWLRVETFCRTIWDPGGSWTGVVGFLLWLQVMWQLSQFAVADCLRTSNLGWGVL